MRDKKSLKPVSAEKECGLSGVRGGLQLEGYGSTNSDKAECKSGVMTVLSHLGLVGREHSKNATDQSPHNGVTLVMTCTVQLNRNLIHSNCIARNRENIQLLSIGKQWQRKDDQQSGGLHVPKVNNPE